MAARLIYANPVHPRECTWQGAHNQPSECRTTIATPSDFDLFCVSEGQHMIVRKYNHKWKRDISVAQVDVSTTRWEHLQCSFEALSQLQTRYTPPTTRKPVHMRRSRMRRLGGLYIASSQCSGGLSESTR